MQAAIKAAKTAHHERAVADIRSRALAKGLTEKETQSLMAAVPECIVALQDTYSFRFYGQDADVVAKQIGLTVETGSNGVRCEIDARDWNEALEQLLAADVVVSVAAMPE